MSLVFIVYLISILQAQEIGGKVLQVIHQKLDSIINEDEPQKETKK